MKFYKLGQLICCVPQPDTWFGYSKLEIKIVMPWFVSFEILQITPTCGSFISHVNNDALICK